MIDQKLRHSGCGTSSTSAGCRAPRCRRRSRRQPRSAAQRSAPTIRPTMIIGSASGKRTLVKIWSVDAPKERASAILAEIGAAKPGGRVDHHHRPGRERDGDDARLDRRSRACSTSSGTSAIIGVVTRSRMYGVTTFSTKGNWVMTAASTMPIDAPMAYPTNSTLRVISRCGQMNFHSVKKRGHDQARPRHECTAAPRCRGAAIRCHRR